GRSGARRGGRAATARMAVRLAALLSGDGVPPSLSAARRAPRGSVLAGGRAGRWWRRAAVPALPAVGGAALRRAGGALPGRSVLGAGMPLRSERGHASPGALRIGGGGATSVDE